MLTFYNVIKFDSNFKKNLSCKRCPQLQKSLKLRRTENSAVSNESEKIRFREKEQCRTSIASPLCIVKVNC